MLQVYWRCRGEYWMQVCRRKII